MSRSNLSGTATTAAADGSHSNVARTNSFNSKSSSSISQRRSQPDLALPLESLQAGSTSEAAAGPDMVPEGRSSVDNGSLGRRSGSSRSAIDPSLTYETIASIPGCQMGFLDKLSTTTTARAGSGATTTIRWRRRLIVISGSQIHMFHATRCQATDRPLLSLNLGPGSTVALGPEEGMVMVGSSMTGEEWVMRAPEGKHEAEVWAHIIRASILSAKSAVTKEVLMRVNNNSATATTPTQTTTTAPAPPVPLPPMPPSVTDQQQQQQQRQPPQQEPESTTEDLTDDTVSLRSTTSSIHGTPVPPARTVSSYVTASQIAAAAEAAAPWNDMSSETSNTGSVGAQTQQHQAIDMTQSDDMPPPPPTEHEMRQYLNALSTLAAAAAASNGEGQDGAVATRQVTPPLVLASLQPRGSSLMLSTSIPSASLSASWMQAEPDTNSLRTPDGTTGTVLASATSSVTTAYPAYNNSDMNDPQFNKGTLQSHISARSNTSPTSLASSSASSIFSSVTVTSGMFGQQQNMGGGPASAVPSVMSPSPSTAVSFPGDVPPPPPTVSPSSVTSPNGGPWGYFPPAGASGQNGDGGNGGQSSSGGFVHVLKKKSTMTFMGMMRGQASASSLAQESGENGVEQEGGSDSTGGAFMNAFKKHAQQFLKWRDGQGQAPAPPPANEMAMAPGPWLRPRRSVDDIRLKAPSPHQPLDASSMFGDGTSAAGSGASNEGIEQAESGGPLIRRTQSASALADPSSSMFPEPPSLLLTTPTLQFDHQRDTSTIQSASLSVSTRNGTTTPSPTASEATSRIGTNTGGYLTAGTGGAPSTAPLSSSSFGAPSEISYHSSRVGPTLPSVPEHFWLPRPLSKDLEFSGTEKKETFFQRHHRLLKRSKSQDSLWARSFGGKDQPQQEWLSALPWVKARFGGRGVRDEGDGGGAAYSSSQQQQPQQQQQQQQQQQGGAVPVPPPFPEEEPVGRTSTSSSIRSTVSSMNSFNPGEVRQGVFSSLGRSSQMSKAGIPSTSFIKKRGGLQRNLFTGAGGANGSSAESIGSSASSMASPSNEGLKGMLSDIKKHFISSNNNNNQDSDQISVNSRTPTTPAPTTPTSKPSLLSLRPSLRRKLSLNRRDASSNNNNNSNNNGSASYSVTRSSEDGGSRGRSNDEGRPRMLRESRSADRLTDLNRFRSVVMGMLPDLRKSRSRKDLAGEDAAAGRTFDDVQRELEALKTEMGYPSSSVGSESYSVSMPTHGGFKSLSLDRPRKVGPFLDMTKSGDMGVGGAPKLAPLSMGSLESPARNVEPVSPESTPPPLPPKNDINEDLLRTFGWTREVTTGAS
ncbi:hypothetical protein HDU97_006659 [Phlyctochytrium planicorne]|nr:hypothetical protein HDU97_006659 [Phlyctochytrium planicorne]